MRERVLCVPQELVSLGPISGWKEAPDKTLCAAAEHLPVRDIALHAKVAQEFGEEYLRTHPQETRSAHQLGAVHLYTQGWVISKYSLYAVLNCTLSDEDRSHLIVWFCYLKLLVRPPKILAGHHNAIDLVLQGL